MGGASSFTRFFFPFLFLFLQAIILLAEAVGESPTLTLDDTIDAGDNSPPSAPIAGGKGGPFKPSVVVIVGVLATLFSLTFLLLLYVKHCKPEDESSRNSTRGPVFIGRKNSGIDRTVIESLPIFRFASLRGQKDGLECAVCLNPFEPVEILRLLPKCKHAFHVECVDTWLDAHSTCPLCRYRVDPEDILLVEDAKVWPQNQPIPECGPAKPDLESDIESGPDPDPQKNSVLRRVSGRHSTEGETTPSTQQKKTAMPFRRSLDSAMWPTKKKRNEGSSSSNGGCGDGPRKDGLLLSTEKENKHRLEHRIIVSPSQKPKPLNLHQRWSDVQPSDLLYLTSEMLLSEDSRRLSSSSCGPEMMTTNLRSVSEITGLSREEARCTVGMHLVQPFNSRLVSMIRRMRFLTHTKGTVAAMDSIYYYLVFSSSL
ncbi:RING-H2 finger protein ATL43-like [Senna tora]|uniref:RING-type E3 ubiquitin transferase n=1 Tax=Senna tora TaxID=362788 RepID=A0A834TZ12_9FABA|nr:RING-H2 finger protein ATL43-like [Senna tora]